MKEEVKCRKRTRKRVVAELTEKLRTAETLFVADYRGPDHAPDRLPPRGS